MTNPRHLLKVFLILSVASVLFILVSAGIGIYRVFSGEMIRAAQETAIHVGNSLFELEREILLKPGHARKTVAVAAEDFANLDQRMKHFLRTFNMYKIKVFSQDGTIIYSTDHKIIGKLENENPDLTRVLSNGEVVSKLERKPVMNDFKGREHFDIDVVETYVPIREGQVVLGAFEVYVDTTSMRKSIFAAIKSCGIVLFGVLIITFGLLFLPIRKGMLSLGLAQDKLRALAQTDVLTGISNRRHIMDRIDEEHARMKREKQEINQRLLAVIMVDIDFFKKINDKHGHQAGDFVLQVVAMRLKECTRVYDTLGRYGGEEFLAVLPNTTLQEAVLVAERMHKAVRIGPIIYKRQDIPVTVSIGVTVSHLPDEEPALTIKRADEALYQAKRSGRDCVIANKEDIGSANEGDRHLVLRAAQTSGK